MAKLLSYLRMIKIEHSLFALPFALSSMMLAANGMPAVRTVFWIVFCMVSARSAAMGMNRWADAEIDARNPRTKNREIPAGKISRKAVGLFILASLLLFFLGCYMLNPLSFMLSPLPVLIFVLYSYSKRFTELCHFILGAALGFAPLGAWIAVTGGFDPRIIFMAIGVLAWCAGFDILYALQDIKVDKDEGLHSLPALLGEAKSFFLARILHLVAFILFFCHGWFFGLHIFYMLGFAFSAALMIYEHYLVKAKGMAKLDVAFFNMNALISIVLFISTAGDILAYN